MKFESILEEIKAKTDIVEFIADYVSLKKAGQNYKGLCPFHSEKTPSFMVSPSKQIFHCFGCGTGGDIVSFLMKQEHLSFPEAIRYVAKKAGIQVHEFTSDKKLSEKKEQILRINEVSMNLFMRNLQDSRKAMSYLNNRGLDKSSLESFHIGYATDERDSLYRHLKKSGFTDSPLKESGIIISDTHGFRDVFRKRIIFPIMNMKGDVIAFGGRVMDNALPKYLNSPETEVFKKGETLFALNRAKDDIRKKDYAIIVEGYLDAILCHQYGFTNAIAPLGTSLTSRQVQKLSLLTKKVLLVFDSDQAGISAARRSLSILCENDFRAKVLLLPEGEDPDSFLRKKGPESFKLLFAHAMSMTEFLMNTSGGDRMDSIREALSALALMKDLMIADEMLCELADRSRIHESLLRSELEKIRKKAASRHSEGMKPSEKSINREECLLLSALIAFPEKALTVLPKFHIEDIHDSTIRSVLYKMKDLSGELNVDALLNVADEAERTLITGLSLKPGFDIEHVDENIADCLLMLEQRRFEERKILAEKSGDVKLLDSLLKEKRRLTKRTGT